MTIHDIAREAGVSARTVSRALNGRGYVAQKTRDRIQAVVDRHGYLPSRVARSLRTGRSHEVCVVVGVRPGDLIMEEIAAMEKPLRDAGYWISILHVDERATTLREVAAELRDRRPAALVTVYSRNVLRFQEHFEAPAGNPPQVMIDLRDGNAAQSDYRLGPGSPATDAGLNFAWMQDPEDPRSLDLDGNPRILPRAGGTVDLGAYERDVVRGTMLLVH